MHSWDHNKMLGIPIQLRNWWLPTLQAALATTYLLLFMEHNSSWVVKSITAKMKHIL